MTFGNGAARSYGWDAAGRLAGISVDLAGSAADQRIGQAGGGGTALGYNAAAQLVSAVRANTAYAWGGSYNVNRTYANNGLNQVTAAASTVFGYDARGNLTSSGGTTYGYDGLNQLTSVSGGWNATLSWDTAGRLNQVSAPGSSATRFLYDGSALIGEYSTSGALLRRHVHGPLALMGGHRRAAGVVRRRRHHQPPLSASRRARQRDRGERQRRRESGDQPL